jgi:hypothetical protein
MAAFEVAIYNSEVRARVADGIKHRDLSDNWADIHYIEIEADDEAQALEKIQRRYPARRGYVIDAISEVKE